MGTWLLWGKGTTANNDTLKPRQSILQELTAAGLFWIAGIALLLVVAYAFALPFLWSASIEQRGQWGDSFGALTALLNALAFAAVVATVVLQSREAESNS